MKGRRSHLKAMKDLTAGEDRNDNVSERHATNQDPQLFLAFNRLSSLLSTSCQINKIGTEYLNGLGHIKGVL